jgi:hypothetical protein
VSSGAVAIPATPAQGASAQGAPGDVVVEDVTASHAADVAAAADRYDALGVDIPESNLSVFDLTTNEGQLVERVILPDGAQVMDVEGNQIVIAGGAIAQASVDGRAFLRALRAGGPVWKMTGSQCFSRWQADGVYMDSCHKDYVLLNEGDNDHNYYAVDYYGTAGPDPQGDPPRTLQDAGLAVWSDDSRAAWHDWDPRADSSGSCSSITLGVSAFGVSIGSSVQRCETWDIGKPADVNDPFWNVYQNHDWPGTNGNREVALWEAVTVPQGNTPHAGWSFAMALDGWVG